MSYVIMLLQGVHCQHVFSLVAAQYVEGTAMIFLVEVHSLETVAEIIIPETYQVGGFLFSNN